MCGYMPRKARIYAPEALHQMIVRGIGRRQIFSSELGMDHEQIWTAGKLPDHSHSTKFIVLLDSEKVGFQYHRTIQKACRLAAICKHFCKVW